MDEADKVHWSAELEDFPRRYSPWGIYYKVQLPNVLRPTMHWFFLTELVEVQFLSRPQVLVRATVILLK